MPRSDGDADEASTTGGRSRDGRATAGAAGAAIDVDDLELTYGDGTRAVGGIDMTVMEGEFFGFLGPNGAGKTTTIKVLATLLAPTAGTARVNGFDVREDPRAVRESIGYMAQETAVDPELTARENVRFACEAYGVPRVERRERVDELLELVGLTDVAGKHAEEFSGGMKKRLDAATALVHEPPLVFLDEPTTGLDPTARNRLWEYFRRINDRGTTIVLTTQYLAEADELCERLAVIAGGEIVAEGTPGELKRRVGGEVLEIDLAGGDASTEAEQRGGAGAADASSGIAPADARKEAVAPADARERAVAIAREVEAFADARVDETDDGITVTTESARQHGTDLLVALRDAGLTVTGLDVREPTLDDVFLAITGEGLDESPERRRVEVAE